MYHFSRAIYRELAPEILEEPVCPDGSSNHEHVLRACEAAVLRLATDRHYFAKPAQDAVQRHPGLLPDVRAAAASTASSSTYLELCQRVARLAAGDGLRPDGQPARVPGDDPQGPAVPAHAAAAQRLLPVAPAPRRGRGGARRRRLAAVGSRRAAGRRRRRDLHGRGARRRRPAGHREGADDAATTSPRACSPRCGPCSSARASTPGDVEAFAHGTTVATNALLEGRGARTVLVATAGFEDVVELGRQARADLYRLCAAHPAPLVPPERRVGARRADGPGRRRCAS